MNNRGSSRRDEVTYLDVLGRLIPCHASLFLTGAPRPPNLNPTSDNPISTSLSVGRVSSASGNRSIRQQLRSELLSRLNVHKGHISSKTRWADRRSVGEADLGARLRGLYDIAYGAYAPLWIGPSA